MDHSKLVALVNKYIESRNGSIPSVFEAREMIKEFRKEATENSERYNRLKQDIEDDCVYSILSYGSYNLAFSLAGLEISEKFKELGYSVKYENREIKIGIV